MMNKRIIALLILITVAITTLASCTPPPAAETPVQVEGGKLSGIRGKDPSIRVFKGIPYAAPPIFDRRWQPPQPVDKWEGIYRADRSCAICMQHGRGWGEFYQEEFYQHPEPMSEDCLYLNLWTGAKAGQRQPVLVWIHGGSFAEGSGSLPSFDGETLAKKGLVVVTINYRLSVFGFLAHPELTRESVSGTSGNYGLLDQIAALRWVQKNIAAFGGDPQQVTVAGQSAGSSSVHHLTVSPLAKGLFLRAIAQSGSGINRMVNTTRLKEAEQAGTQFAASVKAASLRELRGKPAAALLQGEFRMRPIVDGWVLPDDVYPIMAQSKQNDVPMLTGMNSEESIGFQPQTVKARDFQDEIRKRYTNDSETFLKLYPAETDEAAQTARDTSTRDQAIVSLRAWARLRSMTAKTPLYVYYFSRKPPGRDRQRIGAFHSGEIEYVFGTLGATDRPWEEVDRRLSDTMTSYWANFITRGDPNGPELPTWPPYSETPDQYFELGDTIGLKDVMPAQAKLDFFTVYFARTLKAFR
jgi:para-nitrobenzyl esterase